MTDAHFEPLGLNLTELVRRMQAASVDGMLVTSPENVFYTTGFPALPSSGNPILYALRNVLPLFAYISAAGRTTLMCWGGAAANVSYGVDEIRTFADLGGAYEQLTSVLKGASASTRLGIESSCPYAVLTVVEETVTSDRLSVIDHALMMARLIKSPREVALLERSIQAVEGTVAELMQSVHIGMNRVSLMQAAKVGMLRHGATGISHVTISFGASNPEVEINETLHADKLVTLDVGAIVQGYHSDNRRLMFSGSIPAAMRQLHETMCGIVDEVARGLAPGNTIGDVYDCAMSLYAKNGLTPFIPNIGHTIGLQVEETWIHPSNGALVLVPGIVLNLEMYAVYETGELIGDEETYVISDTGARQLTRLPTAIRSVTE